MGREEPYIYIYLTKNEGFWGDLFVVDDSSYPYYHCTGSGKVFRYDIESNRALIYYDATPYWIKVKKFCEFGAESFIERIKKKG